MSKTSTNKELNDKTNRKKAAENLLNNALFKECFTIIESNLIDKWRGTKTVDSEAREWLWLQLQSLKAIQAHLQKVISQGKIAEQELMRRYDEQ